MLAPQSSRPLKPVAVISSPQFGELSWNGLPNGQAVFQGDFFGENYTPKEFGYISDDELESDEEDEEDRVGQDRDDACRAGLEDGYEAPRPPVAPVDVDTNMPDVAAEFFH
ncbi:hypothetical protein B0H10DRAFT_1959466 [Mycena sp. CBHHK59/15]|nr:hypothetical protein B0H10DRAFT_1959466 [Mycena sp. CBHHK59/15]